MPAVRRQGQLLERRGLVAIARPRAAAPSWVWRRGGPNLLGVGAGVSLDLHHIGDLAIVQPSAELAHLPVAGVTDQHRRSQVPLLQLIQHVQHQLPLGPVPHLLGHMAGRPPLGHGVLVPALGHKQPPVQGAAGLLGHGVDRHPQLAVGRLAQRARVLALHPYRTGAVLGEPSVVHRPRHRTKRRDQHLGQPSADRPPVPRRDRHEMMQRLVVDLPQPLGHRLHRLAPAIQHQPTQITLPTGTLILPRQRLQDVLGERFQAPAHGDQLGWCDAPTAPPLDRRGDLPTHHPTGANLTESY